MGGDDVPCSLQHGTPQLLPPQPARRDVVHDHDRIVDHHSDSEHQPRQRNDIDRDIEQVKDQDGHDERHGNGQDNQQRRFEIAHEKQDDDAREQGSRNDIADQIIDRIVEQLRLIPGDGELHIGVVAAELDELFIELRLELRHAGVGLFDDGQRDGAAPVRHDEALPFARMFDYARQLPETEQTAVDLQENPLDILFAAHRRLEFDAVLILSVTYGKAAERDVRTSERLLYVIHGDTGLPELRLIGQDQQLGRDASAQIDHRHLGELLDAFRDDAGGETTQRRKLLGHRMQRVAPGRGRLVAQGEIDIKSRNIGGARLDDLGPLQIARGSEATERSIFSSPQ